MRSTRLKLRELCRNPSESGPAGSPEPSACGRSWSERGSLRDKKPDSEEKGAFLNDEARNRSSELMH